MKIQIRQGVFETNSSSTHSLQITKGGIEEAKSDIIKNMFSTILETYISQIVGNKIIITGLHCKTGGEESDIYTIITNWEAKLQYLASQLYGMYEDEGDETLEYIKNIFTKCTINILKSHGIDIDEVEYDIKYISYIDDIYCSSNFEYNPRNKNNIENYINFIMDDSFVLTFGSEAYSSYEGKKIYIIQ